MKIQIPYNWHTRPYQTAAYNYLTKGGKRYVGVNHRRWGKDALLLNSTCYNMHKRIGTAWHMLPEASQARKAIWDAVDEFTGVRLIDQAFPKQIRSDERGTDMFLRLKIGSTWQVVGSDNFDSLIGSPPVLVVFSEFAYANPMAWQKISPILMNNGGIAAFISTPCGRNHFHGLYQYAKSPEGKEAGWFAELQTVEDTDAIVYANFAAAKARGESFVWMGKTYSSIEEVDKETRDAITKKALVDEERQLTAQRGAQEAQAIIQQEYYCSFQAAIPGAYYGSILEDMERGNRFMRVPHDPGFLVECWWDLGIRDDTAIWFVQHVGRERRVIDYYEAAGVGIDYYVDVLNGKCTDETDEANSRRSEYRYAPHVLPHDAYHRQLTNRGGASLADVIEKDYRHNVRRPGPSGPTKSLQLSIQRVRTFLKTCVFDKDLTQDGRDKLSQYRRVWNPITRAYNDTPLHDFCFTGDTEVLTRYGMHRIMDLPPDGKVMTSCGWKRYTNPRITRRAAPLVAVKFKGGLTVKCTPDHLFKTLDGWKSAESLQRGSLIQSCWMPSHSTSTTPYGVNGHRVRTTVAGDDTTGRQAQSGYTARYGSQLSEKSPEAVTSTTGMGIRTTIGCRISNVLMRVSMCAKGFTVAFRSFLMELGLRLRHGIVPMLAGSGTSDMLSRSGLVFIGEKSGSVLSAERRLMRWLDRVDTFTVTVPTHARHCRIESVEHLSETQDVWCLTVPDAEEFALANGALVHNCSHAADAFRTGVEEFEPEIAKMDARGVKSDWDPHAERRRGKYAVGAEDDVLGRD